MRNGEKEHRMKFNEAVRVLRNPAHYTTGEVMQAEQFEAEFLARPEWMMTQDEIKAVGRGPAVISLKKALVLAGERGDMLLSLPMHDEVWHAAFGENGRCYHDIADRLVALGYRDPRPH